MSILTGPKLSARLAELPKWQVEQGELVRTFAFRDFRAALAFVNEVGECAERAGHHPDIDIRYNRVRLALVTHDAGGLTEKDFALAAEADKVSERA
ncbi:MAG: 4a-hydroxytetrahydrobiopterin dehydratase [Acidobacteriota bacterium]|nr:4a-hydroxytetrahydrobiopterin dehydratase [Acidobacteriota bacterium]MDE3163493.1 4a-hydroxytetrahydrobiopterin dehydratase [Acidobacteriota bacterium]